MFAGFSNQSPLLTIMVTGLLTTSVDILKLNAIPAEVLMIPLIYHKHIVKVTVSWWFEYE